MTTRMLAIVGAACFIGGTAEAATNLKPLDPVALRGVVEATAKELMTAAVIVQLVQEGKLGFDDLISKYVQGVPNGDDITISELLKMRSGLPEYTSAPELGESLDHDPARVWTPQELLAIAFKRPAVFRPGKEYDYCNTNYALLGLVAEKLEGAPLARIFQDRLFGR